MQSQIHRKQCALLRLIAKNPSNRQIIELCEQWNVPSVYFASTVLNRLATLAKLADYVLKIEDTN